MESEIDQAGNLSVSLKLQGEKSPGQKSVNEEHEVGAGARSSPLHRN